MRSDLLHVVTCIYNPIRWGTRIKLYRAFRDHMIASGVHLHVVECQLGERPFELMDEHPQVHHVPVRADTLAWNKENLVNIGLHRLPLDAKYIAWIDADVEFENPNWAAETVHALQQYAVVQPWSEALDLGPKNEPMCINGTYVQISFAKVWHEQEEIKAFKGMNEAYSYPHPGYAWATRRDFLNNVGGLIEVSGLGAGDHQMAMAIIGNIVGATHGKTNPAYQDAIRAWGERAYKFARGNLGYVQGTLRHSFHGSKPKRKYQDRWDILIEHDFNPVTDLKKNMYGVLELAGNKPAMERAFDKYFRQRDEDANILF